MRTFVYFVILILCTVCLGSCTTFNKKPIDEPVTTELIEQEMPHVPTVHDVLEERKELQYALWVDSVYLNMPEQILIQMLASKGTTLSIVEIVEDYWANKQFYHDTVLKSMNIQKKYIPDSLPKHSKPDKQLNSNDTINKINM